jgi:hypothetical protein
MEISLNGSVVNIKGNIKSVSDFKEIKSNIEGISKQYGSITINIIDSLSMTSSVIGYFNKLILKDKVNIQMNIGNKQLIELLNDLNLSSVFNVRKA